MSATPRLLVIGTGRFARDLCTGIAEEATVPVRLTVAGRDVRRTVRAAGCANVNSVVETRTSAVDISDAHSVERLVLDTRPDVVALCASGHSTRACETSDAWATLLQEAGLGLTAAMQAAAAQPVGRACAAAGAVFLNACLPDLVNPVLVAAGIPVAAGLGNVASLARVVAKGHGIDESEFMLLAHHVHLHSVAPSDEARAWWRGQPMTDITGWLADARALPRRELNRIGARGSARAVLALVHRTACDLHLPGPAGLPGGYPVHIRDGVVTLRLPVGTRLEEIVDWQRHVSRLDGAWPARDGRLHLSESALDILNRRGLDVPDVTSPDEITEAAERWQQVSSRMQAAASSRRLEQARWFQGLPTNHGPVPAEPFRIGRLCAEDVQRVARRLLGLIRSAVLTSGASTRERRRALGTTVADYPLLTDDEHYEVTHCDAAFRPDIVFAGGIPRFLEFNVSSGIGGVPQTQQAGQMWQQLSTVAGEPAAPADARARFLADVHAARHAKRIVPIVADLTDLGSTRVVDVEMEALARVGLRGVLMTPEQLPALLSDDAGEPSGPGFLYMTATEWTALGIDLTPLREVISRCRVELYSSQTSELLGNKRVLAWLSAGLPWFRPADRQLIERHIPWTREARPTVATGGRQFPTEAFAVTHQADLVLKTNTGMQADGVTVGCTVGVDEWRDRVRQAVRDDDAILQRFVRADPYPLRVWTDDTHFVARDVRTVWNPFFFGEHFGGFGVRYSMQSAAADPISGSRGALAGSAVVIDHPHPPRIGGTR